MNQNARRASFVLQAPTPFLSPRLNFNPNSNAIEIFEKKIQIDCDFYRLTGIIAINSLLKKSNPMDSCCFDSGCPLLMNLEHPINFVDE